MEDAKSTSNALWRIEMLANANGFPVGQGFDEFGFRFSGPGLNGRAVSIRSAGNDLFEMRVPPDVLFEIQRGTGVSNSFHIGADGVIAFNATGQEADAALRRAAALMRSLPDTPLAIYRHQTGGMPTATEVERLAKQRVGQDIFRRSLEDYWGGKCAVTGIADRALLRASHTKRWADCESDEERLDVHNGFLLAAHIDAAFDAALLTFDQEGAMVLSSKLSKAAAGLLSGDAARVRLVGGHQGYLEHHRERFRLLA